MISLDCVRSEKRRFRNITHGSRATDSRAGPGVPGKGDVNTFPTESTIDLPIDPASTIDFPIDPAIDDTLFPTDPAIDDTLARQELTLKEGKFMMLGMAVTGGEIGP